MLLYIKYKSAGYQTIEGGGEIRKTIFYVAVL